MAGRRSISFTNPGCPSTAPTQPEGAVDIAAKPMALPSVYPGMDSLDLNENINFFVSFQILKMIVLGEHFN